MKTATTLLFLVLFVVTSILSANVEAASEYGPIIDKIYQDVSGAIERNKHVIDKLRYPARDHKFHEKLSANQYPLHASLMKLENGILDRWNAISKVARERHPVLRNLCSQKVSIDDLLRPSKAVVYCSVGLAKSPPMVRYNDTTLRDKRTLLNINNVRMEKELKECYHRKRPASFKFVTSCMHEVLVKLKDSYVYDIAPILTDLQQAQDRPKRLLSAREKCAAFLMKSPDVWKNFDRAVEERIGKLKACLKH